MTQAMVWGVSTGEGQQITIGVTEDVARRVAQREANARGEAVCMWPVPAAHEEASDDDEIWVSPREACGGPHAPPARLAHLADTTEGLCPCGAAASEPCRYS